MTEKNENFRWQRNNNEEPKLPGGKLQEFHAAKEEDRRR